MALGNFAGDRSCVGFKSAGSKETSGGLLSFVYLDGIVALLANQISRGSTLEFANGPLHVRPSSMLIFLCTLRPHGGYARKVPCGKY